MDGMNKEKWKSFTPSQKREHIWEYYRLHIIAAILLLAVGGWMLYSTLTYVEPQMEIIMTDMREPLRNDAPFHGFLTEYGYEVYDKSISLNQNLHFDFASEDLTVMESNGNAYQVLFSMVSLGNQDLLFSQTKVYASCAADDAMMDLSKVLPKELLEKYDGRFLYVTDEETGESYPCGVDVAGNPWMEQVQKGYAGYVGIFSNADDVQKAADFIAYFLSQFDQEG